MITNCSWPNDSIRVDVEPREQVREVIAEAAPERGEDHPGVRALEHEPEAGNEVVVHANVGRGPGPIQDAVDVEEDHPQAHGRRIKLELEPCELRSLPEKKRLRDFVFTLMDGENIWYKNWNFKESIKSECHFSSFIAPRFPSEL